MKILTLALCIILGGYVISEIVVYTDPVIQDTFAGMTQEEIDHGVSSLTLASGDDVEIDEEPDFEVMAIEEDEVVEEKSIIKIGTF